MTDHHALDATFDTGPEYRWEEIPANTPKVILDGMGGPEANRVVPGREAVRVVRTGMARSWAMPGQLVLEDGSQRPVGETLPADLPLGYHDFFPTTGDGRTRVIVTPWRCIEPRGACWGWAVQLHSTRSRQSWGIGDMADLKRLAKWSAGLGAGMVLINPLGPPAPVVPQGASPYYPTTRRFRNPLYLRIEDVPGAERLGPQLAATGCPGPKLECLAATGSGSRLPSQAAGIAGDLARGVADDVFIAFRREQGVSLERFATFCTLAEEFGHDWRNGRGI